MSCLCHSKLGYDQCCRPFHEGHPAPTALQLVRSRYCAYALCLPDYIIETTHTANPHFCHDLALWSQEIATFCVATQFKDLEILSSQEDDTCATVTFRATLLQHGQDISFTEKSTFKKIQGKWLYLSGRISKDPQVQLRKNNRILT